MLAGMIALAGCGGSDGRGTVTGKVTVAGKGPLTGGSIQFISVADASLYGGGQIRPDGTYEVVDAPLGECKVVIDNKHLQVGGNTMGPKVPGGMGGGMPTTGMGPKTGKAPAEASKQMNAAPKCVEVPSEMGKDSTTTGAKYIKIDPNYAAAGSTTLKATVNRGTNTADFEVK